MTTHRFSPLPEGSTVEVARAELTAIGKQNGNPSNDMVIELVEHCESGPAAESHFSACMDWAAQLRMGGMEWGDAIRAAMILYFG